MTDVAKSRIAESFTYEYMLNLATGELLTYGIRNDPEDEGVILRKYYMDDSLRETYYIINDDQFRSVLDADGHEDVYARETAEYENGCNVRFVRQDGVIYFVQENCFGNVITEESLQKLPEPDRIFMLMGQLEVDVHKLVQVGYVIKTNGLPYLYFLVSNKGESVA